MATTAEAMVQGLVTDLRLAACSLEVPKRGRVLVARAGRRARQTRRSAIVV